MPASCAMRQATVAERAKVFEPLLLSYTAAASPAQLV